ncbi:MAG: UDP-N-acetylmuramoyl-tripeptide--D-alanyl-D-alanine ligase, partial [Candidatus Margulisbacteria bacterium]|nr:UDP-N-acetylmuramoyl-tripeptide--D-alanyl-D-alanine ligase [Candidatus Margulisiibacteriota bacterium]
MKFSIDSRTIQPGDIFIPVKGENFDGHAFIKEVLAKGAAKVLDVDLARYTAYYRQNKIKAKVIGVTGSAGKTTVKDMITAVLRTRYKVHKTKENENNEIGVPLTLLNSSLDCDFIVVEMAMRKKGEILGLAEIARPDYVLISSIGSTHIEFLGSKRNIALAKAEIFRFQKQKEKTYYTV